MSTNNVFHRQTHYGSPDTIPSPPEHNKVEDESEGTATSPPGSPPTAEVHVRTSSAQSSSSPPASPGSVRARLCAAAEDQVHGMTDDALRSFVQRPMPAAVPRAPAAAAPISVSADSSPEPQPRGRPTPVQAPGRGTHVAIRRVTRADTQPRPQDGGDLQVASQVGAVRRPTNAPSNRQSPYIFPLRARNRDGSVRMQNAHSEEIAWVDIREARSAIRKLDDVFSLGHSELALATATSIAQHRRIDPAFVQVMPPPFGMTHQATHAAEQFQRVQMVIHPQTNQPHLVHPAPLVGSQGAPAQMPPPPPPMHGMPYHVGPPPGGVPMPPAGMAPPPGPPPQQAPPPTSNNSPPTISDRRGRPPPPALHMAGNARHSTQ